MKALPVAHLAVYGFDLSSNEQDREKAMMRNFMNGYSPAGYNLVLTGNVHARLARGMPWNANLVPFAAHLNENFPMWSAWPPGIRQAAHGIARRFARSTDWIRRTWQSIRQEIRTCFFSTDNPAYNGYFRISKISASRPVFEK